MKTVWENIEVDRKLRNPGLKVMKASNGFNGCTDTGEAV